jgi:hypothetical protein
LDVHLSAPRIGAAITSLVERDTAKFSSSQVELICSWTHMAMGVGEVHSSMPTSKSKLNAVHPDGSWTRCQLPPEITWLTTGAIECMQTDALLQS